MSQHRLPNKAAREFDRIARRKGFSLVRHGKHLVYERPGVGQITVAASASDARAMKNNVARMERMIRAAEAVAA